MFERYTEQARRAIFYARYEASQFGSGSIEPEHLLLAILREDQTLRRILPFAVREQIREQIESRHEKGERVSTSVDLPLSGPCKRALDYAAEEAESLGHKHIEPLHLMVGLLRLEPSVAGELLKPLGIATESVRAELTGTRTVQTAVEPEPPASAPLHPLDLFVAGAENHLYGVPYSDTDQVLRGHPWTRKQALGHLIDYATAHHQWISRAMVEPRVNAAGYPGEERALAQNYAGMRWLELVRLWIGLNHLLGHVILQVPAERMQTLCKIGIAGEIPLEALIQRYSAYVQDLVAQILTRG